MSYANPFQTPMGILPASRNISYAMHLVQEREVLTERDVDLITKNIENYIDFENRYYSFIVMTAIYAFILLHCNNIDPKDISSQNITLPKANMSKKKKCKKKTNKKISVIYSMLTLKKPSKRDNLIGTFEFDEDPDNPDFKFVSSQSLVKA